MLSIFKKKPRNQDEFAEMMRKRLLKEGVPAPIEYNAEDFCLILGDKRSLFLGNIYDHYNQSSGREQKAEIDRFIRGMLDSFSQEIPKSLDEARARLLPIVRERMMFEHMRLKVDNPDVLAFQPWVGNLCLAVAYDSPDTMATVNHDHLKDWGLSLEEAIALGRNNLGGMTKPQFQELAPGLFMAAWDDDYDSSRLLLPHLWNNLKVEGDVVAISVNRNRVFATGSESALGLKGLMAAAQSAAQEPRAMRPTPLVLRSGEWQVFHYAGDDAETRAAYELMALQTIAGEYEEQQAILNQLNEAQGVDLFVASFMATQNKDTGELMNYCTWVLGLDTIIPRASKVAIVNPDLGEENGLLGMADWDVVANLPEVTLEPQGMYPERYKPIGRPTDEFLATLTK